MIISILLPEFMNLSEKNKQNDFVIFEADWVKKRVGKQLFEIVQKYTDFRNFRGFPVSKPKDILCIVAENCLNKHYL